MKKIKIIFMIKIIKTIENNKLLLFSIIKNILFNNINANILFYTSFSLKPNTYCPNISNCNN